MGSQGALIAQKAQSEIVYTQTTSFSVKPVDTTVAGDAFVGALAVALSEGLFLPAAARFASAAAAISVTRVGAAAFPARPPAPKLKNFCVRGYHHEEKSESSTDHSRR